MENNHFEDPLDKLFSRLNYLYGLLLHMRDQLDNFRNLLNSIVQKNNLDISEIYSASTLVYGDITGYPKDESRFLFPSGKYESYGKEYLKIIDVVIEESSAWTISQAYEAFETSLKNITATFLYANHEYSQANKLNKFNSYLGKNNLVIRQNSLEYWGEFVRYSYKNSTEIIRVLRRIIPRLKDIEENNGRAINLKDWFAVISEARHAITHSSRLIKDTRIINWTEPRLQLLYKSLVGENITDGYKLKPNTNNTRDTLQLFCEYAFVIFKLLSELMNYDTESYLSKYCRV